jgi:hypothetical protein
VLLRIISVADVSLDVDPEGDGFGPGDNTLNTSWDDLYAAVAAL